MERRSKRSRSCRPLDYFTPRWSPDDRSIAFIANERNLANVLYVTDTDSGTTREIVRTPALKGLAWLPDGSGLVYASAAGSTLRYPPVFNLRTVSRDGGNERQLTIGDVSYVDAEIVQAGKIFASRIRMQSDIWRFPISGNSRRERSERDAAHPSDGAGADTLGEP